MTLASLCNTLPLRNPAKTSHFLALKGLIILLKILLRVIKMLLTFSHDKLNTGQQIYVFKPSMRIDIYTFFFFFFFKIQKIVFLNVSVIMLIKDDHIFNIIARWVSQRGRRNRTTSFINIRSINWIMLLKYSYSYLFYSIFRMKNNTPKNEKYFEIDTSVSYHMYQSVYLENLTF